MQMTHDIPAAKAIMDALGGAHDGYDVFGADVLVAVYTRPEKTKGGIILTDNVKGEDRYQGKIGLVLKTGPLVNSDLNPWFNGALPKAGDWVVLRVGDTYTFDLHGPKDKVPCRTVEAKQLRGRVTAPDTIW